MRKLKKLACVVLPLLLVTTLCIPAFSFAESTADSESLQEALEVSGLSAVEIAENELASANFDESDVKCRVNPISHEDVTGTCTATVNYYENITYEDPDGEPNEDGRYLMGTRTITGLSEGDVLDAWDFVVDIPGFFFFDGWPGKPTVSNNPENNVFELIYYREWSSSYTVNYYMMVGADLTASSWSGALASKDVEFIKFDTEVFEDQPYGMLVEGDAYEYRLDGKYVVDTYPPEIRLGSDTDNNVLNVLYVPDSTHLPDDVEIPDDVFSVGGSEVDNAGSGSSNSSTAGSGSASPTLPEDEVLDKDEMEGLLPDGLTESEINQLFMDFIGSQADAGQLEITNEMLANPVDKEEALARIAAFKAGLDQGRAATDQQDVQEAEAPACDYGLCIVIIVLLLVLAIIGYILFACERKSNGNLRKQMDVLAASQPLPIDSPSDE